MVLVFCTNELVLLLMFVNYFFFQIHYNLRIFEIYNSVFSYFFRYMVFVDLKYVTNSYFYNKYKIFMMCLSF